MQSSYPTWKQVAFVLQRVIANIESNPYYYLANIPAATHFDSVEVPEILLIDYVERINEYVYCSECCFIIAFIYIDRLMQNNPGFVLTKWNIHRLFLSAVVLAIKYAEDEYLDNASFARIGGIPLSELNLLEVHALILLQYNLHIDNTLYYQYTQEIALQLQNMLQDIIIG